MENYQQTRPTAPATSPAATLSVPAGVPVEPQQKDSKFETKSTVCADTLSRGLVNLNISGRLKPILWRKLELISVHHREKREKAVHTNGRNVYKFSTY
ncbi:clathrin interactor EPSIN 2-like [Papaver somniferum]|uniref:clathrin interactor EPSIN 2-like n=1 Tax=Papaver somniferum TaxID=3469 RepID=UPI000E7040EF|nr:clathrin interactor EPSIN 2-like [Papaver somniferum]